MITIDGQISDEYIDVIESCCDEALPAGKPVHVYLRNLSIIDQAGRALLRLLSSKGVIFFATGTYASRLLRTLNSASAEQPFQQAGAECLAGAATRRTP